MEVKNPRGWADPDELRIYNWDKIMAAMKELGYNLIDVHEHEFQKNGVSVEYGTKRYGKGKATFMYGNQQPRRRSSGY